FLRSARCGERRFIPFIIARTTLPYHMGNPAITSVRSVKLLEFNQCVDVEECGLIVEHHLSAAMGAPPQARLAFAAAYEGAQAVAQRGLHETEHRLRKQLP